jgi:seryl-tRNA synthetase
MNFLQRFHVATKYYSKFDYELIEEVPLFVEKEIIQATSPHEPTKNIDFSIKQNGKYLVASSEQSILQMLHDGKDLPAKLMTFSSCFRNEKVDYLHRQHFYKLELFVNLNKYKEVFLVGSDIKVMAEISLEFFKKFLNTPKIKQTGSMTFDIESENGIELGSYGFRTWRNYNWLYGTGLAEPRLGIAIDEQKFNKKC